MIRVPLGAKPGARVVAQPPRPPLATDERGQSLIELGIVMVLFVTLLLGILEFGRAWMIADMVAQAASAGARAAAVTPVSNRNPSGTIISWAPIESQVRAQIRTVLDAAAASALTFAGDQPTVSGIPTVRVRVTGAVPYMFNLLGTSFRVDRSVTFRDEGR